MAITTKMEDHSKEVIRTKDDAIAKALEMMGQHAVSYTRLNLTATGAVDTGRLRASYTHVPEQKEEAVYVGTNVEYAPYIEYGTYKMDARPCLKNAINENTETYKAIATRCLNEIK